MITSEAEVAYLDRALHARGVPTGDTHLRFLTYAGPFSSDEDMIQKAFGGGIDQLSLLTLLQRMSSVSHSLCGALLSNQTLLTAARATHPHVLLTSVGGAPTLDSCACIVSDVFRTPLIRVPYYWPEPAPLATPQPQSGLTPADLLTWQGLASNAAALVQRRLAPLLLRLLGVQRGWARVRAAHGLPPFGAAPGAASADDSADDRPRAGGGGSPVDVGGGGGGGADVFGCPPLLKLRPQARELEYLQPPVDPQEVYVGPLTGAAGVLPPGRLRDFVVGGDAAGGCCAGAGAGDGGAAADGGGGGGGGCDGAAGVPDVVYAATGSTNMFRHVYSAADFKALVEAFRQMAAPPPNSGASSLRVLWSVRDKALPPGVTLDDLGFEAAEPRAWEEGGQAPGAGASVAAEGPSAASSGGDGGDGGDGDGGGGSGGAGVLGQAPAPEPAAAPPAQQQPAPAALRLLRGTCGRVAAAPWVPQAALLSSGCVAVFISHGGLHSINEAALTATPLLGLPILREQLHNVRRAEHLGFAAVYPGAVAARPRRWREAAAAAAAAAGGDSDNGSGASDAPPETAGVTSIQPATLAAQVRTLAAPGGRYATAAARVAAALAAAAAARPPGLAVAEEVERVVAVLPLLRAQAAPPPALAVWLPAAWRSLALWAAAACLVRLLLRCSRMLLLGLGRLMGLLVAGGRVNGCQAAASSARTKQD